MRAKPASASDVKHCALSVAGGRLDLVACTFSARPLLLICPGGVGRLLCCHFFAHTCGRLMQRLRLMRDSVLTPSLKHFCDANLASLIRLFAALATFQQLFPIFTHSHLYFLFPSPLSQLESSIAINAALMRFSVMVTVSSLHSAQQPSSPQHTPPPPTARLYHVSIYVVR